MQIRRAALAVLCFFLCGAKALNETSARNTSNIRPLLPTGHSRKVWFDTPGKLRSEARSPLHIDDFKQPSRAHSPSQEALVDTSGRIRLEARQHPHRVKRRVRNLFKRSLPTLDHTKEAFHPLQTELLQTREGLEAEPVQQRKGKPLSDAPEESWHKRFGVAAAFVVLGLVAVIQSSRLLWVNECRNAQLESLISLGESEATTLDTKQNDLSGYDGALVHLDSEVARGLEPVQDSRFRGVRMEIGCLRLLVVVEVYQWQEEVFEKREGRLLGREGVTTRTYQYAKAWSQAALESSKFWEAEGHENSAHVEGLAPGRREMVNNMVKYGESYRLPADLAHQLDNFQNAAELVGSEFKFGAYTFRLSDDGCYKCPLRAKSEPEIGDFRVHIQCVHDGPASILALQMKDKLHEGGRTFGPYRCVPRGGSWCGRVSGSDLQDRLLEAAREGARESSDEGGKRWGCGALACLSGRCSAVKHGICTFSPTPQVYCALPGRRSAKECFDAKLSTEPLMMWVSRLLGWLLLWVGFVLVLGPLQTVLGIIPLGRPILGEALGWVVLVLAFLLSTASAMFIASAAYLVYRPATGIFCGAVATGLFAGAALLIRALAAK